MGGLFDLDSKTKRIEVLKKESENPELWNDVEKATTTNRELANLQKSVNDYNSMLHEIEDDLELLGMLDEKDLMEIEE